MMCNYHKYYYYFPFFLCTEALKLVKHKYIWHSKSPFCVVTVQGSVRSVTCGWRLYTGELCSRQETLIRCYCKNQTEMREIIFFLDSDLPWGIQMWTTRDSRYSLLETVWDTFISAVDLPLIVLFLLIFFIMFLFLGPPLHYMCFLGFCLSCFALYIFPGWFPPCPRGQLPCVRGLSPNPHFRFWNSRPCIYCWVFLWSILLCLKFRVCTTESAPFSRCPAPGPQAPTTFSPSWGPQGPGQPAPFPKIPKSERCLNPSWIHYDGRKRLVRICQFSCILSIPSVVPSFRTPWPLCPWS